MRNIPKKYESIFREVKNIKNHKKKIDFLYNSFEGETCYVLGCGPSISEAFMDIDKITNVLENNFVLTIKASYNLCEATSNFHVFNCNNFIPYSYKSNCIYISQADFCSEQHMRSMMPEQKYDINVRVSHRQQIAVTGEIEKWTFQNAGPDRAWGPGIMYETVLYFLLHLGFKRIKTIGWDYKNPLDVSYIPHFFSEQQRKNFQRPAAQPDKQEIIDSISLSKKFGSYLQKKGVFLSCFDSEMCYIDDSIERFKL